MFSKLKWIYGSMVYHFYRHQSQVDSRWGTPQAGHLKFMSTAYTSLFMILNIESVLLLLQKLFAGVARWTGINNGAIVLVSLVVFGVNYFLISSMGSYEEMKSKFGNLPEKAERIQVRGIQIYMASSVAVVLAVAML